MEHIFSHIHQTYVVQAVEVSEEEVDDSRVHTESCRWVTKEEFSSAAVSTAMKKVTPYIANSPRGSISQDLFLYQESQT